MKKKNKSVVDFLKDASSLLFKIGTECFKAFFCHSCIFASPSVYPDRDTLRGEAEFSQLLFTHLLVEEKKKCQTHTHTHTHTQLVLFLCLDNWKLIILIGCHNEPQRVRLKTAKRETHPCRLPTCLLLPRERLFFLVQNHFFFLPLSLSPPVETRRLVKFLQSTPFFCHISSKLV